MKILKGLCLAVALTLGPAVSVQAATLGGPLLPFYTTYGDANVYSLPTLQYIHCVNTTGKTDKLNCGPNPYKVQSSAGQIKDLTVIGAGASGKDLTQNFPLMNDAYETPSGKSSGTYFSTGFDPHPTSTFGAPAFDALYTDTWNASVASLETFLAGEELLFFFGNNQDGTINQNLAAWGRVWITDSSNVQVGQQYYLTNQKAAYGAGGTDFGDPGLFNGADNATPFVGNAASTDYVLAGSGFCVDPISFLIVPCSATSSPLLEHNIGAEEAGYAVQLPELNAQLATLFAGVANLTNYTLHVEVRLGCEAANAAAADTPADATNGGTGHCDLRGLNTGDERIFIGTVAGTTVVPEPDTLALLGLALVGLGVVVLRKRATGSA